MGGSVTVHPVQNVWGVADAAIVHGGLSASVSDAHKEYNAVQSCASYVQFGDWIVGVGYLLKHSQD